MIEQYFTLGENNTQIFKQLCKYFFRLIRSGQKWKWLNSFRKIIPHQHCDQDQNRFVDGRQWVDRGEDWEYEIDQFRIQR